jgi:hypothetical protein
MPKKPHMRELNSDGETAPETPPPPREDRDLERGEGGDFPAASDARDLAQDD